MLVIKSLKQLKRSITSKVTLTSVREDVKIEKVATREINLEKMSHKYNNVKALKTTDALK